MTFSSDISGQFRCSYIIYLTINSSWWDALLHQLTTQPILVPAHVGTIIPTFIQFCVVVHLFLTVSQTPVRQLAEPTKNNLIRARFAGQALLTRGGGAIG